jgi:putative transposase
MKWKNQYPDNSCFFITSSVIGYRPILDLKGIPEMLLSNLDKCRELFGFKLFGYVIMPEHWHILAYFAKGKDCLSFTRDYKRFTAKEIISILENSKEIESIEYFRANADSKAGHSVWKEQARVIPIAKMKNLKVKLDYIHNTLLSAVWRMRRSIIYIQARDIIWVMDWAKLGLTVLRGYVRKNRLRES